MLQPFCESFWTGGWRRRWNVLEVKPSADEGLPVLRRCSLKDAFIWLTPATSCVQRGSLRKGDRNPDVNPVAVKWGLFCFDTNPTASLLALPFLPIPPLVLINPYFIFNPHGGWAAGNRTQSLQDKRARGRSCSTWDQAACAAGREQGSLSEVVVGGMGRKWL